jgi:hypothetical protein
MKETSRSYINSDKLTIKCVEKKTVKKPYSVQTGSLARTWNYQSFFFSFFLIFNRTIDNNNVALISCMLLDEIHKWHGHERRSRSLSLPTNANAMADSWIKG